MDIACIFLPLVGAILAGLFGRRMGDKPAQWVTSLCVIISAILAGMIVQDVAFGGAPHHFMIAPWFESGRFAVDWAIWLDTLSAVMVLVVTVVSSVVHLYSIGYMEHAKNNYRFMAYLSLFTFAMLMLVTADNLVQMFFGWEGVGLASYLLIGYWNYKPRANYAAIKAFLVNRVADVGFLLGIFTIYVAFDSVSFDVIFNRAPQLAHETLFFAGYEVHTLTLATMLLFIGAMGKSAQLGLHTWLPDAMEGPTPVSALIHAATMVTAGVFMVARMSPVFEYAPLTLDVVAIVGALTAFVGATIAIVQFDIKKVIAYSTMSQLGYMFFALGVSAYGAAIFHLFTHAFFKALLFLGAGSVIHAMSDEQDMRHMGGIWKRIPITYFFMWVGSLALAGIPWFAGYFSKDMILEAAWAAHNPIGQLSYVMGIAAAFLTAFYSWRLIILTFHRKKHADEKVQAHVHEAHPTMSLPLVVLMIGAVFSGYFGYDYFVGEGRHDFWQDSLFVLPANDTIEAAHHVPLWVKTLPIGMALFGIFMAYLFYRMTAGGPEKLARVFRPVYHFLTHKWYFDALYGWVFEKGSLTLGWFCYDRIDRGAIESVGPGAAVRLSRRVAQWCRIIQTGFLYHYAAFMLGGLVLILTYFLVKAVG